MNSRTQLISEEIFKENQKGELTLEWIIAKTKELAGNINFEPSENLVKTIQTLASEKEKLLFFLNHELFYGSFSPFVYNR